MPNLFYTEGMNEFHRNNYDKAKVLFLQAIYKNPEYAKTYFYLGQCHFFCDEKNQAIIYLKRFIDLKDDNSLEAANVSYALDVLGQCYEAGNNDTKALKCYEKAISIYSSCASAWHNMGLLFIKFAETNLETDIKASADFFANAQTFIKKALVICSNNPMFLHSIASWNEHYIELLVKTIEEEDVAHKRISKKFDYAIGYYRQALEVCKEDDIGLKNIIQSNLTECLAQYGHHLYRNKYYNHAQRLYLEVIQLDPSHLIAINQLGMSLFKQESFKEARDIFSTILEKTNDKQEMADAWLNIACTYRLEKKWDKAKESLKQAKILAPEDPCIDDEEIKLIEAKLSSTQISTLQTLFGNLNTASQNSANKAIPESTLKL